MILDYSASLQGKTQIHHNPMGVFSYPCRQFTDNRDFVCDYVTIICCQSHHGTGVRGLAFFPPLFKVVLLGFFLWLLLHPLLRDWVYSGEIWHPTLFDLSLFILCIAASLGLLIVG